ncbi:MAG: hypothetical protein M1308_04590 [Actinobacteria bacterium]|nr:hypothetical protein [Actinomycetota bacterium]
MKSIDESHRKHVKGIRKISPENWYKKPGYILSAVFLVVIIIISTILFIEIKNSSNLVYNYQKDLSNLSASFSGISKVIDQRFAKLSSAELLLNDTNRILSTVYFGTADTDVREEARDFTAFSMLYNDEFYLITAGHSIEIDGERYKNFKFKANNSKSWIRPELLDYKSDYKNNLDYAIFYSENIITMGLIPAKPDEDLTPQYVLGNLENNLNLIKRYSDARQGESGSPILNSRCHVIGLMIKNDGNYTPIQVVLDALANLPEK